MGCGPQPSDWLASQLLPKASFPFFSFWCVRTSQLYYSCFVRGALTPQLTQLLGQAPDKEEASRSSCPTMIRRLEVSQKKAGLRREGESHLFVEMIGKGFLHCPCKGPTGPLAYPRVLSLPEGLTCSSLNLFDLDFFSMEPINILKDTGVLKKLILQKHRPLSGLREYVLN